MVLALLLLTLLLATPAALLGRRVLQRPWLRALLLGLWCLLLAAAVFTPGLPAGDHIQRSVALTLPWLTTAAALVSFFVPLVLRRGWLWGFLLLSLVLLFLADAWMLGDAGDDWFLQYQEGHDDQDLNGALLALWNLALPIGIGLRLLQSASRRSEPAAPKMHRLHRRRRA